MYGPAILLLLATCSSAFMFSDSRCHEGPAYWCSSMEVAASCEATQYCQENIWTVEQVDEEEEGLGSLEGNPVTCKLCVFVTREIEKYLLANNGQIIVEKLEKLCGYIPKKDYVETCKEFVKSFGADALAELAKELGPQMLCKSIGMCNAVSAEYLLMAPPKSETCPACKEKVAEMRHQIEQLAAWWKASCGTVKDTPSCLKYAQYAKLLNTAFLTDALCYDMDLC